MKIRSVKANNRRKAFEVKTHSRTLSFPYIKAEPRPTAEDPVETAGVDKELAREALLTDSESVNKALRAIADIARERAVKTESK